jgi:hypothetical protein
MILAITLISLLGCTVILIVYQTKITVQHKKLLDLHLKIRDLLQTRMHAIHANDLYQTIQTTEQLRDLDPEIDKEMEKSVDWLISYMKEEQQKATKH